MVTLGINFSICILCSHFTIDSRFHNKKSSDTSNKKETELVSFCKKFISGTIVLIAIVLTMEEQGAEDQKPSTSNEMKNIKREDSLSVVGVELIDSMASNPFVDRVFKAAITMVLFLLFSGLLWCASKVKTSFSDLLEQIAVTVFILTLVVFAISGLVFMCSILLISSNDRTEIKNSSTADNP